MRERLSVNPLTILYSSKSVKYISLTLELATCTHTYFVHVILVTPKAWRSSSNSLGRLAWTSRRSHRPNGSLLQTCRNFNSSSRCHGGRCSNSTRPPPA